MEDFDSGLSPGDRIGRKVCDLQRLQAFDVVRNCLDVWKRKQTNILLSYGLGRFSIILKGNTVSIFYLKRLVF